MTFPRLLCFALLACGLSGCAHTPLKTDLNFSHFHNGEFQWKQVGRVLVLPVVNESPHPEATEQFRTSLTAELQALGLFEVVATPPDIAARLAQCLRETGRFNEADVIHLSRCAGVDAVVVVTLSHYSPYLRPRIGAAVQALSPDLGKVVAGVDGLWDSNNLDVADRARRYYARKKTPAEHVIGHVFGLFDDSYGSELVLESPHLYQRYVASEVVRILVGDPALLASLRPLPPTPPKPYSPRPMFTLPPLFCRQPCEKPPLKPEKPTHPTPSNAPPLPAPTPAPNISPAPLENQHRPQFLPPVESGPLLPPP